MPFDKNINDLGKGSSKLENMDLNDFKNRKKLNNIDFHDSGRNIKKLNNMDVHHLGKNRQKTKYREDDYFPENQENMDGFYIKEEKFIGTDKTVNRKKNVLNRDNLNKTSINFEDSDRTTKNRDNLNKTTIDNNFLSKISLNDLKSRLDGSVNKSMKFDENYLDRDLITFDRFLLKCESLKKSIHNEESCRYNHYIQKLTDDFENLKINIPENSKQEYESRIKKLDNETAQNKSETLEEKYSKLLIEDEYLINLIGKNEFDSKIRKKQKHLNDYNQSNKKINKSLLSENVDNKSNKLNNHEGFNKQELDTKVRINDGIKNGINSKKNSGFNDDINIDRENQDVLNSNLLKLAKNLRQNIQTTSDVIGNDFNNISSAIETVTKGNETISRARVLISKTSRNICSFIHIISLIAVWISFIYCIVLIRFSKISN